MLIDRPDIVEGSAIQNASVAKGSADPANPNLGELFFRADLNKLRVYSSSGWTDVGASASALTTTELSIFISNAVAVAGNRALVTFPNVPFQGTVRVNAIRAVSDGSGNQRVDATFDVSRGGGTTGANAYLNISRASVDDQAIADFKWYFDTSTGTVYLRFGQTGNSWTYSVITSLTANVVPTIVLDGGTAPTGTITAPLYEQRNLLLSGLSTYVGGTLVLQIDGAGNVGLGATPTVKLDIRGSAGVEARVLSTGAVSRFRLLDSSGNGSISTRAGALVLETGSAERARIDAAGNFVIGATTAGAKLDVVTTSGNATSRVFANSPSTTAISLVVAGDGTTSSDQAFTYYLSNKTVPYSWKTGLIGSNNFVIRDETVGVNRVIVDPTGKVGIGVASPQALLDVAGEVRLNTTSAGSLFLYGSDTTAAKTGLRFDVTNLTLEVYTNATKRMAFDGAGNVVIGTGAILTNSTDGFLYLPTTAGVPTGTPTTHAGRFPLVFNNTSSTLYYYNSGWKTIGAVGGANQALQFNDNGSIAGATLATYNKANGELTANILTSSGAVSGTAAAFSSLYVSGNASQGIIPVASTIMDLSTGNYFTKTVSSATAFTFTNVPASKFCTWMLKLTNGAAFATTWPASVKWQGGIAPTLTTAGVDIISFFSDDGGTTIHGFLSSKDSK